MVKASKNLFSWPEALGDNFWSPAEKNSSPTTHRPVSEYMGAKKTDIDFSKGFEELENITRWFDSQETLDLDAGLKKFERGLELSAELKKKLTQVENKVEEIKQKFSN